MRILNVGCGDETYGTDFLDLYPQRKEVIRYDANIDKMPYKDKQFDRVVSHNLFEHLQDRMLFLNECRRVLKDDGIFELQTDNAFYYGFHFNRTHSGGYSGLGTQDIHYSLFTVEHLKNYLKAADFEVLSQTYKPWMFPSQLSKLVRLLVPYKSKCPYIIITAKKRKGGRRRALHCSRKGLTSPPRTAPSPQIR